MKSWAIFCKVIDNYGDIGVSWRLARQLADEYSCEVTLWVDQLHVLAKIWPEVDEHLVQQRVMGVMVRHWRDEADCSNTPIVDVLIEAFACDAPTHYVEALAQRAIETGTTPKWANLEYLSAEQWVDEHHLLNSPQRNGLNKVFFFPGFTPQTGGLLREKNMVIKAPFFYSGAPNALKISLFGYDDMPLNEWLPCLVKSQRPIELAVTSGKATVAVRAACQALGISEVGVGSLVIVYLPMLTQLEFDGLLQQSDLNFVRGEDSLVRALWAEKPLTWHIYPQDDGVHWVKLAAFMDVYGDAMLSSSSLIVWQDWQRVWNGDTKFSLTLVWKQLLDHLPALTQVSQERSKRWQQHEDLASQLNQWAQ